MTFHIPRLIGSFAAPLIVLALVVPASAAVLDVGGTYNVSGTNFPVNFGPTPVTLDGATHALAGGQLNVRAEITDVDADTQWLEFIFSTPGGGPIAGNPNAFWDFEITDIPYTEPVLFAAFFYYWTIDGVAVPNIQNWQGGAVFTPGGLHPIDPSRGMVFGGTPAPPGDPPFDPRIFITPYNLISTSVVGGDPTLPDRINDFHVGMLVTAVNPTAAVPEPASLATWGALGTIGLAWLRKRKRRK
jgi:hypothetical protein